MSLYPIHATLTGPLVLIGFGSIGKGMLPLLERHLIYDKERFTIIDPNPVHRSLLKENESTFLCAALTPENYRQILQPLLTRGDGQALCINVSVDTSSLEIMRFCREIGALYIDTVVEPWPGTYFNETLAPEARTNYMLREKILAERCASPTGPTAVSCCGANPGMVSWFVKRALMQLARDLNHPEQVEILESRGRHLSSRKEWAQLACGLGVKGIHIAERDTQYGRLPKPAQVFVNTWSVEGFLSEGLQPAELGFGTHERWRPANARAHASGCQAGIYLLQPGANTRVRSWTPTGGPQYGFLVTHNESLSISDYYTLRNEAGEVLYRPTCHYAYHPCNDAVLSLHELFGRGGETTPKNYHILTEEDIVEGVDELGVLLYGHQGNAYWYGSHLTMAATRDLAPYQNATGLQVTSAVLAGLVWALENPRAGIIEADEMDYERCLEIQEPYLGKVFGIYTDWTPLSHRSHFFPEEIDPTDPWQFKNVLVT